ncbi:hypothetical protein DFH06DRAFT_1169541 [Mycena polygramma]|nr:hypothetical protein DFH06DRAFT_1169541 [Mycena polygramma]
MDEPQDEASRLNNEARKLFSDGKFEKAGRLYEAAHKADTTKSPIYLSNLALVQLKLEQFRKAEKTATKALVCNPRFTKARYRRATSRWRQGRPMDALVDLASVLTSEPTDKAAASMFAEISSEIEALGSNRSYYRPMTILIADFPSAYGSSTVPRPTRDESPNKFVVPNKSERIPKELRAGTCASCKTVKWMREVKTCRQCSSVVYCNERCQRKHW